MSRRKSRVGFFDRAVALIAAVLVFGGFGFFLWTSTQEPEEGETLIAFNAKEIATIAASTVTEDQIKKQKNKILDKEKEKKRQEKKKQDLAKKEQELEKKKLEDIKKEQEKAKKNLEDIKKKQLEEKKAIALRKKKEEQDEKKRKLDEKKRKDKEAEDKKRKLAEKKKLDDAKKKLEAANAAAEKKKQDEALAKKNRQDSLQSELAAERDAENQRALTQQSARESTTLKNRYAALITEKLESNFVIPVGARPTQVPVVNIKLDPSGNVLSSRIVTGSGDFSYDQAVVSAVGNSSPLPLPQDNPVVRKELQDISLKANF